MNRIGILPLYRPIMKQNLAFGEVLYNGPASRLPIVWLRGYNIMH